MSQNRIPHRDARFAQRGVVLFISLIVLVVMSIAGLTMMRSVTGGMLVAGNLAFKRAATTAADRGIELGRSALVATPGGPADDSANGYYAAWGHDPLNAAANFVASSHNWDSFSGPVNGGTFNVLCGTATNAAAPPARGCVDAEGNRVRFVTHRMCAAVGAVGTVPCLTATGGTGLAASSQSLTYNQGLLTSGAGIYYRVTARVDGPKGTVSYVQTVLSPG